MEYQSPLGFNFRLRESTPKEDSNASKCGEKCDRGNIKSDQFQVSTSKSVPYDNNRQFHNRNSYNDRRPGFHRDQSGSFNSPGHLNKGSRNFGPPQISQYYDSSMLENPWKELEERGNAV